MAGGDLHHAARALFERAVREADPARALRRIFSDTPLPLPPKGGRLFVIGWGKASIAMVEEVLAHVPMSVDVTAIGVTNYENFRAIKGAEVFAAGHPLPDQNGLEAAKKVRTILEQAKADDRIICLISGGGSALLPSPLSPLSLKDKIAINALLLKSGFDIIETNCVRQHLSALKGGGVARLGAPAKIYSFIVSDVIGDDIRAIASGPTAHPLCSPSAAISLLKERGLWEKLPAMARQLLSKNAVKSEEELAIDAENRVICSNRQSLEALCQPIKGVGRPKIVSDALTGDVQEAAHEIVSAVRQSPPAAPLALLWGGETTVTVAGNGQGGRNQELCLHVGKALQDFGGKWVFLSGGTDGRDGPTDAAGGLIGPESLPAIAKAGLDIEALLANNDSYKALEAAGALLKTGGTGTNVADIQIFMKV